MNSVEEMLDRTGKQVLKRELPWLGVYFLLIILSWAPFFLSNNPWWLCLPIAVVPLIYVLAQKQSRLTKAVIAALPEAAKEEIKQRQIRAEKIGKKYLLIMTSIMVPLCIGLIFFCQHLVMKKKELETKEWMKSRIQQMQQKNAPKPQTTHPFS